MDNISKITEDAAIKGSMKEVYDATRTLCGENIKQLELIKDNGNLLTKETELRVGLKEYFEENLNRSEPQSRLEVGEDVEENKEVDIGYINKTEIKEAILHTKKESWRSG